MRHLLLVLLACQLVVAEEPRSAEQPRTFVMGISPFLENSVKDEVYRSVVRLIVEGLPLDSKLVIFDAFNLKSVTEIALPNLRAFDSPKTRANQFGPALRELKAFLAQEHPQPKKKSLSFTGALLVPQFCDFLNDNLGEVHGPVEVMLIGSPLYQDAKEPAFSMVDGYFPSDGHLLASRDKSVFGAREAGSTPPLIIHWVYFGDPWVNDLHKEKVTRFWTLYLERRGGQLVTFSGDLPTAAQAFKDSAAGSRRAPHRWAIDNEQTKIEMLRITRDVPTTDWLTGDLPSTSLVPAPTTMVGPMRIGIRWNQSIDLDLYATPQPGAETLFFQHPQSSEGYYYKDHRSSPGREYEFIEFLSPVDARQVEASVNFYKGHSPSGPRGEVRIEFDGRIYSAPFSIEATEGNRGRSGRSQQDFWTRIPVQQILRIGSAG